MPRGWRKSSDFRHRHRSACRTHPCDFWRSSAAFTSRRSQFVPLCVSEGRFVSSGRLHEKGGKHHEMPVHHTLEEYLDRYIEVAGIKGEPKGRLFRASNGKTKILSDRPLDRKDAFGMVQRRARAAGIATKIGCHTFRATGITIYLTNGGDLEKAQQMAAHESPRTTKLYDRRSDVVSLDEVEKVVF